MIGYAIFVSQPMRAVLDLMAERLKAFRSTKAPGANAPDAFLHRAVIVRRGPSIYPDGWARPGFRRFL
jgi:hypothetical protein